MWTRVLFDAIVNIGRRFSWLIITNTHQTSPFKEYRAQTVEPNDVEQHKTQRFSITVADNNTRLVSLYPTI